MGEGGALGGRVDYIFPGKGDGEDQSLFDQRMKYSSGCEAGRSGHGSL
jgi:hypothetical protein